jgi:hypothetical protein
VASSPVGNLTSFQEVPASALEFWALANGCELVITDALAIAARVNIARIGFVLIRTPVRTVKLRVHLL